MNFLTCQSGSSVAVRDRKLPKSICYSIYKSLLTLINKNTFSLFDYLSSPMYIQLLITLTVNKIIKCFRSIVHSQFMLTVN